MLTAHRMTLIGLHCLQVISLETSMPSAVHCAYRRTCMLSKLETHRSVLYKLTEWTLCLPVDTTLMKHQ